MFFKRQELSKGQGVFVLAALVVSGTTVETEPLTPSKRGLGPWPGAPSRGL